MIEEKPSKLESAILELVATYEDKDEKQIADVFVSIRLKALENAVLFIGKMTEDEYDVFLLREIESLLRLDRLGKKIQSFGDRTKTKR